MDAKICDLCKKIMIKEVYFELECENVFLNGQTEHEFKWDLCKDCYEKLLTLKEEVNNNE